MNRMTWKNGTKLMAIVLLISAALGGCGKQTKSTPIEKGATVEKKELIYEYAVTAQSDDGSVTVIDQLQMSEDTMFNCIRKYCESINPALRFGFVSISQSPNFFEYRRAICAGDILKRIVENTSEVVLNHEGYVDAPPLEYPDFGFACMEKDQYDEFITDPTQEIVNVAFAPVETNSERKRLRSYATASLSIAWKNVQRFISQSTGIQEFTNPLISNDDRHTGMSESEVLNEVVSSTSFLITQIRRNKTMDITETINDGIVNRNQWFDKQSGRIPAFKSLYTASRCAADELYDGQSGLCWKRCPVGAHWVPALSGISGQCELDNESASYAPLLTWQEAQDACAELGDGNGYRLPTVWEYVDIGGADCNWGANEYLDCTEAAEDHYRHFFDNAMSVRNPNYAGAWTSSISTTSSGYILTANLGQNDFEFTVWKTVPEYVWNAVCVREREETTAELLPPSIETLPTETSSMYRAVALLGDAQINIPCFATDDPSCDTAALKNVLMDRVNTLRDEKGLAPFSSFDQLEEQSGINSGDIAQAVEYMYSHLLIFPRDIVLKDANGNPVADQLANDPSLFLDGWDAPFMTKPPSWYVAKNSYYKVSDVISDEIPSMLDARALDDTGAADMLIWMQPDINGSIDALNDLISIDSDRYAPYLQPLLDARDALSSNLGSNLVDYEFFPSDWTLKLTVPNPTMSDDNVVDEYRAIPIGATEDVHQFDSYLCAHSKKQDCSPYSIIEGTPVEPGSVTNSLGSVLGAEDEDDWEVFLGGITLGTSTTSSEGAKSLAFDFNGQHTQIVSVALPHFDVVYDTFSIDIKPPPGIQYQYPWFGVHYASSSTNGVWQSLGDSSISTSSTGFQTFTFDVDEADKLVLSTDDDISIIIQYNNGPTGQVLIDNINLGIVSGDDGTGGGGVPEGAAQFELGFASALSIKYWVIERSTKLGQKTSLDWNPIGVLNIPFGSSDSVSGTFINNGPLQEALVQIVTPDSQRLSGGACEGPNGECLDPDWVPAIQNEVISDGSQYETSYKYYLNLARAAAEEARVAREVLMNDILEELSSEEMEKAQVATHIDRYISSIKEICGEGVDHFDFGTAVNTCNNLADQSSLFNYKSCLLNEIFSDARWGCNYRSDDPDDAEANKSGAVYCSVDRVCGDDVTLGQLGVLRDLPSDDDRTKSKLRNRISEIDELIDINAQAVPCEGTVSERKRCLKERIYSISNKLEEYRVLLASLIRQQNVHEMPDLFTGQGLNNDFLGGVLSRRIENHGFTDGLYYEQLNRIGTSVGEVTASATKYISVINELKQALELLASKLDLISEHSQLSIISGLASALVQAGSINIGYEQGTKECLRNVQNQLGENTVDNSPLPASLSENEIRKALDYLNDDFRRPANWAEDWSDVNSGDDFAYQCEKVLSRSTTNVLRPYALDVCDILADVSFLGKDWYRDGRVTWEDYGENHDIKLTWECRHNNDWETAYDETVRLCYIGPGKDVTGDPDDVTTSCARGECSDSVNEYIYKFDGIRVICKIDTGMEDSCHIKDDRWAAPDYTPFEYTVTINGRDRDAARYGTYTHVTFGRSGCGNAEDVDELCLGNDSYQFGYDLGRGYLLDEAAEKIHHRIREILYMSCDQGELGCRVESSKNSDDEIVYSSYTDDLDCNGPASSTHDATSDWEEGGDLYNQTMAIATVEQDMESKNLAAMLTNLGRDLVTAKVSLSNNIRSLVTDVASLTGLEEQQISLFNEFVNNRRSSVAANVTNLEEWGTRYDFRREDYNRKLARARYQAWIALKAIEFRFGIKLDAETQSTPVMDAPQTWAKMLWDTNGTKCGGERNWRITTDDLEGCLTPEDLIENYVQNLDDFVNSYGNNPTASSQWWFHEDDDTGVLSVRDHLTNLDVACNSDVGNMLYFTEEFDMDEILLASVYGESSAAFDENIGTWVVAGSNMGNLPFVVPNEVLLGAPGAIESTRLNESEAVVYSDMSNNYTADMILMPWDSGDSATISQTLDKVAAAAKYYGEEDGDAEFVEFSLSHRMAPLHNSADCKEGEVFYPAIGKCGVPCSITTISPAPQGDCASGQVCAEIADARGQLGGERICTWCTADLSCEQENGQGIRIALSDGEADVTGERNVQVYPFWKRDAVSTLSQDSVPFTDPGEGMLKVSVESMTTTNLIPCSENYSGTDCNWYTPGDQNEYTLSLSKVLGPDGSMSATEVAPEILATFLESPQVDLNESGGATLSFWARHTSDVDRSIDATLVGIDGGNSPISGIDPTTVPLSNVWKRYAISLAPVVNSIPVDSVKAQFTSADVSGDLIQLWGVQIEEGQGRTPYVATGKNLLSDSVNILAVEWSSNIPSPSTNITWQESERGPDDNFGVWQIDDDNPTLAYQVETSVTGVYPVGSSYTFSLWVKNASYANVTHSVLAYVSQLNSSNTILSTEPEVVVLTQNWQRLTVPVTVSQLGVTQLAVGFVAAYADTAPEAQVGRALLWGPQLEKGDSSTGYQRMNNGSSARDWGFDVGLGAASLVPVEVRDCYTDGKLPFDECEQNALLNRDACCQKIADWFTDGISSYPEFINHCLFCDGDCNSQAEQCEPANICGGDNSGSGEIGTCLTHNPQYVRNTYQLEHYPWYCEVDNSEGYMYPLAGQLQSWPSDQFRTNLFKAYFQKPDSNSGKNYYSYTFNLDMNKIELADTFNQFGLIAPNNFNYRIRTVAANVVGTDVINCSMAESPSTCAANQWLSYDLSQTGPLHVKNHRGESFYSYNVPMGYIRGGKAWASEQVIGYPISGAHQSALAQLQKVALMGRPLDGTFELRIYDTPELNWENVEDIQLVLGYHYWTKSE